MTQTSDARNTHDATGTATEADPAVAHEVTGATQEVRIASAMTGGVSLAIWMGGVARELNLLDQASRLREARQPGPKADHKEPEVIRIYQQLLDRLDQVVRIDVLSGTSAGGINAAILGFCHANGVDMGILKKIWLAAGSFDRLLREPTDATLPSLLQGDGVLLEELNKGLAQLYKQAPTSWAMGERDTEVFITTALLDGEASRFTDSYGTLVKDVDHLGIFRFDKDDLTNAATIPALALAGRSSASFPAAFEPGFLPLDAAVGGSGADNHPPMGDYLSITRPHWVADGGLLANRPIRPLLDAIFEQPAQGREVRRTLLYVVPDPGGSDESITSPDFDNPPTMGEALLSDLGAMLNQSIADDLNAISEHNDRVDAMRDTRLRLAELAIGHTRFARGGWVDEQARKDYARRQGEWVVRPIVTELTRQLSVRGVEAPAEWREMLEAGSHTPERCRRTARAAINAGWSSRPTSFDELAGFGRPAYDAAKGMAISILRSGYPIAAGEAERRQLADLGARIHAALPASSASDTDEVVRAAMVGNEGVDLAAVATQAAETWLADRAVGGVGPATTPAQDVGADLTEAWQLLAGVLLDARSVITEFTRADGAADTPQPAATDRASTRERRQRSRQRLLTFQRYLFDELAEPADLEIAIRLLDLYVAERSMLPIDVDVEQPVQLIQVSANTRTLLDPQRANAKDKLTGVQFHHFGAFYKASWRANDWMWGRLDGVGWIVHMLLDPKRIAAIHEHDDAPDRAGRFLADLEQIAPLDPSFDLPLATRTMALDELRFLDDPDEPLPVSLPVTALRVAAAIQQLVATTELPTVAEEAASADSNHEPLWAAPVLRAHKDPDASPTAVAKLLPDCPVPDEKLKDEVGEPLFTQTLTKTLAVTAAASTSLKEPPAALKPVISTARTTTLAMYRAGQVSGWKPKQLMLGGAALAVVGAFLAVHQRTLFGLVGTASLFAGLALVAIGVYGWSRRLLPSILGVFAVVALVALCLPWFREWVHGEGGDDRGWLATTLEPWMRDTWWSSFVVIGIMALCFFLGRLTKAKSGPSTAPDGATR